MGSTAGNEAGTGLARYVTGWHPEPQCQEDVITAAAPSALAAVLDDPGYRPAPGEPLPPLWHWLFFLEWVPQRALGADGHPREGGFLPPIPNRRRMFAGGRLRVITPLELGAPAQRLSTLASAEVKHGRSGEMLLATVRHEISQAGTVRLVEEQDLVYRSGDPAPRSAAAPALAQPSTPASGVAEPGVADLGALDAGTSDGWRYSLTADPVLLFRFSALTANAHRIHYDQPYATGTEHYPGLVVHGPLLVLLMLELVRRNLPAREVNAVSFRLRRPVFAGEPILVTGTPSREVTGSGPGGAVELAVRGPEEQDRATARVELS